MPGLVGLVSSDSDYKIHSLYHIIGSIRYGRANITESFVEDHIGLGCVHLGTGDQRYLYKSTQAVVVFYGYLTNPVIPPGADPSNPDIAAHYIHDLYMAKGESYLMSHIAGSFSLAIWDKRTRTLLIASDHLGLRPIYFAQHKGIFRFASEVKGILSDADFPHNLDHSAIADFFHFSYVIGDKTFFKDIKLLPPASILRYHEGSSTITHYWDIEYPDSYPNHPDEWYEELIFNALNKAVQRMANSRVRYGLSLSGGMDSRWIAAFLSKVQANSLSFTVGIPGSDDTDPARAVSEQTNLHHTYWDIAPNFVSELGETYSYIVDGMYDLFSIEEFPLTIKVGDYADISVGGLLGDCLFGHEINPISVGLLKKQVKKYWLLRNKDSWLNKSIAAQIFGEHSYQDYEMAAITSLDSCIASSPSERGFQVLQYMNLRNRQPRYINIAQQAKLTYVDIYHPITDHDVIQAALLLPPSQLMMERAYRRALKNFFPDLAAIPWTFTLTPPTISLAGIIIKKASQLTLGRWLRKTSIGNHPLIRRRHYYSNYSLWSRKPMRSFIEDTLFSPEANATGLFDPTGLRAVIRDHMEGIRDVTTFIGQALTIAMWTRLFYTPSTPIRPSSLALIETNSI